MSIAGKIKRLFRDNKAFVLMYHRVADIAIDPWELAVSKDNFASQLALLKQHYNVVPVKTFISHLHEGKLKKRTVCITFDDGYQDNLFNALPLLKEYKSPATFFIATGFTGQREMFWWDVLTEIFLSSRKLPALLQFNGVEYTLENNGELTDTQLGKHRSWKWPAPPPTQRCEIYLRVWEYLKPLHPAEIVTVIRDLTGWSALQLTPAEEYLPMTVAQLQSLSADQLFSLGAHTVRHPALGAQTGDVQKQELIESRDYLYRQFDHYTDTVAYPYGHFNEETVTIMRNENFEAGFTTEEKPVTSDTCIYQLGRFQVKNENGSQLKERINKWLNQ